LYDFFAFNILIETVHDIQMMPNNQILGCCSGKADRKIKLFDMSELLLLNNKPTEICCVQTEHSVGILSLSFSDDNLLCCSVSADKSLSLFAV